MHFEFPRIDRVNYSVFGLFALLSAAYLGVDHDVASL